MLAFHSRMAARANREDRAGTIAGKMLPVMRDLHSNAIAKLFISSRESKQFIGRSIKPNAELLQGVDSWSGFSARNGTEVSWTEAAEFRSGFVGKITTVTEPENGGGKLLGEHGIPRLL